MEPVSHQRHSIRVPGYDYSRPGAYFVTIVTKGRECLLGEVREGKMELNAAGKIVWKVWNSLPSRYSEITLGTAAVMPNHFHGIIEISAPVGAIHELPLPDTQSLSQRRRMILPIVVGYFKMQSAKRINLLRNTSGLPVWQRNYYEHIVCNGEEYERIGWYIDSNPENWEDDEENILE